MWSSPARPDPLLAALELTRSRALALAAGDAEELARVSVPGSALADADAELLEAFEDRRVVPGSVRLDVVEPAHLLRAAPAFGTATVALAVRVRGEVLGDGNGDGGADGDRDGGAGAREEVPTSRVELDVRWFDGGWRVSEVRAAP